eukprot:1932755-Rhodomonas_salina.1
MIQSEAETPGPRIEVGCSLARCCKGAPGLVPPKPFKFIMMELAAAARSAVYHDHHGIRLRRLGIPKLALLLQVVTVAEARRRCPTGATSEEL